MEAEKTEGYRRLPSPLSGTGYQRKPWGYSGIAEGMEIRLAYLKKSCTLKEVFRRYLFLFIYHEYRIELCGFSWIDSGYRA